MHKYPKIRRPGHSSVEHLFRADDDVLYVTEKMDGNSFRFQRDGAQIRYGSRNCDLGTDPDEIGGMFEDVAKYIDLNVDVDNVRELEVEYAEDHPDADSAQLTFFGENAVQHTIEEYNWEAVPQFQLFDVFVEFFAGSDEIQERIDHTWESFSWVKVYIADELGLETVPVIQETTVGSFLENTDLSEYDVPESTYRKDGGPAEGVVFRNEATGEKAKYISDEFTERHKSAKQGDLEASNMEYDHGEFMRDHVTERRIEKNIAKLVEEPDNDYGGLEMEMMADLHQFVWDDIWAEDYEIISNSGMKLNLDSLHNRVASRAASVLEDMIQAGEQPVVTVDTETGRVVGEEVNNE